MIFREITASDVGDLFAVRTATRENDLSREQLTALEITGDTCLAMLAASHRVWLCEQDGWIVGFFTGNRTNEEMWLIAVLPDHEGRGIGAELLARVEDWLWSEGWDQLWLTTDVDTTLRTRASGLQRSAPTRFARASQQPLKVVLTKTAVQS